MSDNLKDILSGLNNDMEQEKLLQYLNSHLKDSEQHEFEQRMNDDEFINDAVEGLQQVSDKENLPILTRQLNDELKKQLDKKKRRRKKRNLPDQSWIYFSVVLLILLIVVGYIVIKRSA